jgi:hypothetical protein
VLLAEIDLDRGREVLARPGEAFRELAVGERALRVLAGVERRDRNPVVRTLVAVEDVDHVAAQAPQASRDLDVLARPAFEELVLREPGPLADEAEPPDHAASVRSFETDE